jgi:hypothetical protein
LIEKYCPLRERIVSYSNISGRKYQAGKEKSKKAPLDGRAYSPKKVFLRRF